jgi:general secretion pathway protein L
MKSIGLDITPSGVAVVELSADRTSFSVRNGHFFPLNINDLENWDIDLLQALKEVRSLYDFEEITVCVGLSQSATSSRNITFPFSRRTDIIKSLPFELEEELPLGSEDCFFDAKTVSIGANESSVLAYAIRIQEVQKLIDILAKVQIDPDIISVEGAAFANLFENWSQGSFLLSPPDTNPGPLTLRVFFRHESTLLALFRDNQMIFARSIAWGERNIISEIIRNYNYPYEQADLLIPQETKLLLSLSGATANDIKSSSVVEKALRPLMHELRLMFIEIQDRYQSTIEHVVVSGKIANIENINAYFTKHFAIPFNTERIDGEILSVYQVDPVAPFADKMAIAIGLAVEGFKRPKNPAINFRQGECAKRNLFLEKTWAKWQTVILFGAVTYFVLIAYGFIREQIAIGLEASAYEQLQKSADKIAGLKGSQATPDRIQDYLDAEDEKIKNLKIFEKVQDIEPAMKVVASISSELPSSKLNSYDIRKVNVKFSTVTIEGEAKQKTTVDLLRKKLQGLSSDKKIQTVSPSFPKGPGIQFAFKFQVKG